MLQRIPFFACDQGAFNPDLSMTARANRNRNFGENQIVSLGLGTIEVKEVKKPRIFNALLL